MVSILEGLLEPLNIPVLQILFTILRMLDRPSKKKDYISRFMEIPTNTNTN